MPRGSLLPALVLLLLAAAGPVLADGTAPSPEALAALERFLDTDCEIGAEQPAVLGLVEHGAALEPELGRILRDGSGAEVLDAAAARLAEQWDERSAFLATNPPLGLDPAARLDVTSVTREAWIERGLLRLERARRTMAAAGLAAIGSPRSFGMLRDALDQVADPSVRGFVQSLVVRERVPGGGRPEHPRPPGGRPRRSR